MQHLKDKGEIMVYRIYVEKKREFAHEAASLKSEIVKLLQIDGLEELRIVNRYDVENLDKSLFDYAVGTVFSEPQVDIASETLDFSIAVSYTHLDVYKRQEKVLAKNKNIEEKYNIL